MFKKLRLLLYITLSVFILSSCGNYNKILKSTDYEYKYKKAIEYYNDNQFVKSGTLLKELIGIYRGTNKADKVYYYFAKSMFGQRDYGMAGLYFSTLLKEYPTSEFAEDAQFMVGFSKYKLSPKPKLDQTVTKEAIESLELYNNLYPYSKRVEESKKLISQLQKKLQKKSYLNAKLYYDFKNYKAAVVALNNALVEYPQSFYREELMFMLLKSKYLLAMNSVADKKEQRLSNALDEYFSFADQYPESKHMREAKKFYKETAKILNYKESEQLIDE